MFGFKQRNQNNNGHFKEYGLGDIGEERARNMLKMWFELKAIDCTNDFRNKSGSDDIDEEFFTYLDIASLYSKEAYFVKQTRKKMVHHRVSEVHLLPNIAVAQLVALELTFISASGEDASTLLVPTSTNAKLEIEEWRDIAFAIQKEASFIKAQQEEKWATQQQEYENSSEKKLIDAFNGNSNQTKLNALQNSTPNDWHWLVEDSELELEEVKEFVWLFSQPNCELGTAIKYLEKWSQAEPWDDIRHGDDLKYVRQHLFPVYKVIIQGINTNRFPNNLGYFTQVEFNYVQSVIKHQESEFKTRGPALFEINPGILSSLRNEIR